MVDKKNVLSKLGKLYTSVCIIVIFQEHCILMLSNFLVFSLFESSSIDRINSYYD